MTKHLSRNMEHSLVVGLLLEMEIFYKFCAGTTLHGWGHIPGASVRVKILWSLTILGSLVAASYFTSRLSVRCISGMSFKQIMLEVQSPNSEQLQSSPSWSPTPSPWRRRCSPRSLSRTPSGWGETNNIEGRTEWRWPRSGSRWWTPLWSQTFLTEKTLNDSCLKFTSVEQRYYNTNVCETILMMTL